MLNTRHLQYFLTVAELRNITRAAERLHISQPALSKQIGELERQLSAILFVRNGRTLDLTPAGEILIKEGRRYLAFEESICRKVREAARSNRSEPQPLRLGYTGALEVQGLPTLIQQFRIHHPGYLLDVQRLSLEDLITSLQVGQTDAGLLMVSNPKGEPGLACKVLCEDPLCAVASPSHPLVLRNRVYLRDVVREPLILCTGEPIIYDRFMDCCRETGLSPNIVDRHKMVESALLMVRAGAGITILSEQISATTGSNLLRIPVQGLPSVFLTLSWRPDNENPGVALLAKLAVQIPWKAPNAPED